jgi:putative DNA primase/helicase
MLDGCAEWLEIGLNPPAVVLAATEEYIREEDTTGQRIDERCAIDPIYFELAAVPYADWRAWAQGAGEFVGSQKTISQALAARGYKPSRKGGTGKAGLKGIALKPKPGGIYDGGN